jgi:RimJ/RimL family protein N-acetyltransferase
MAVEDIRIETERLLLRLPEAADFEAYARFAGDEESMRYLSGIQVPSVAWRAFAAVVGSWHLQGFGMFSVIEKASGAWIGRIGPWRPHGWPGNEIGWSVIREAWGKGYALEAATASMDWAFEHLGWDEVIHSIDPPNIGSKRVAEKLGSRLLRVGRLPEPVHEHDIEFWGQTRAQWRARR